MEKNQDAGAHALSSWLGVTRLPITTVEAHQVSESDRERADKCLIDLGLSSMEIEYDGSATLCFSVKSTVDYFATWLVRTLNRDIFDELSWWSVPKGPLRCGLPFTQRCLSVWETTVIVCVGMLVAGDPYDPVLPSHESIVYTGPLLAAELIQLDSALLDVEILPLCPLLGDRIARLLDAMTESGFLSVAAAEDAALPGAQRTSDRNLHGQFEASHDHGSRVQRARGGHPRHEAYDWAFAQLQAGQPRSKVREACRARLVEETDENYVCALVGYQDSFNKAMAYRKKKMEEG